MRIEGSRFIVTGGSGFLGRSVVSHLHERGAKEIICPNRHHYDLRNASAIREMYHDYDIPDAVIHCAANVGGIGLNRDKPAELFYDNAMMGIQLIHESYLVGVSKLVIVGTVCSYPGELDVPFREDDLWKGYPERTNAAYGMAKKMLLVQAQAYRQQYGFNAIYLLPTNLYGPGDNFDPDKSHVIPALIRRFYEAHRNGHTQVVVWGDGRPTREFIHVDEAARGIVMATERYDQPLPVNLGSRFEIGIRDLAYSIAQLVGFRGNIVFNPHKPNGQMRRRLDIDRAESLFGFVSERSFIKGLADTVEWYKRYREFNA